MKVVITDVSVLFDMLRIGILSEFFALEYDFCITDTVYNEILTIEHILEFQDFVQTDKLKIIEVSQEELDEISSFKWKYRNRSINDKSILWKALKFQAIVLSCDNKIKKEALHLKLEVHGSIWVIQELENRNIISSYKAIELLEQLKLNGAWLPINEIENIIKRLKLKMD